MNPRTGTVVVVYNRYLSRGGEDEVFESEVELLERHGWNVIPVTTAPAGESQRTYLLRAGASVVWSRKWHRKLARLVATSGAQVVHVHNTFPSMSPSILHAARGAGAAVVHTLHNYRLVCANALCFRDGRPCEDCVGRRAPWPSILHACYRGSRTQSAGVAAMLGVHRGLKTWERQVDVFVGLTEFQRSVLIRGGLPASKIVVKPNFVSPDPGQRTGTGRYCLFVGKLLPNKGASTLLSAWESLEDVPLKILGERDPPASSGSRVPHARSNVELLAPRPRGEVMGAMKEARLVVVPSEGYETASMVAIEAFACGVPVLASRIGAIGEIVEDGRTGLHFEPGNPRDLAEKARWAWDNPDDLALMGREARREYQKRFTPERNYEMLMEVYDLARHLRLHG